MEASILDISALIASLTPVSTVDLISDIKATHFVNGLSKNVSLILTRQQIIDQKLKINLNTLEDIVLTLGQKVK